MFVTYIHTYRHTYIHTDRRYLIGPAPSEGPKLKTLNAIISKTKTLKHLWDPSFEIGSQNTHFQKNCDRGSPLLNKRITQKRSPISKWNPVPWAEKESITLWYDVINDWKIIWKDWLCIWTRSNMIVKTFKIIKLWG